MARVDRYIESSGENTQKEAPLSRVSRNQDMYDEIYMNTRLVDINNVLPQEDIKENEVKETEEPIAETHEEVVYEEKSYNVNDYIEKAHEKINPDNAKRDINSVEFKEQEDEIRRLIDSINEKEEEEDFFKDLKGDNEDTLVEGKMKTDDFNDSIYEALKVDKTGATILDHALSDKTVYNLEEEEEKKLDHTFEEILKSDNRIRRKRKQLPIIIFSLTLFVLIIVILIVVLK